MCDAIHLRKFRISDVDSLFDSVQESLAELCPWMPWCRPNYQRDDASTFIESRPKAWDSREEFSFLIEDSNGRFIGTCGLNRFEFANGTANLGYWIRTSATKQGLATAAVGKLKDWAFADTELHRLEIIASVENIGSCRVAAKAGAKQEGILRQRLILNGRRHDCAIFSLLKP